MGVQNSTCTVNRPVSYINGDKTKILKVQVLLICSGQEDGKVSLWSKTGDLLFTWWPHEAPVTCVALR
jgi:hypothetical protein